MAGEARDIIKRSLDAFNSNDMEGWLSAYTDDIVYEDVAMGKTSHGKGELRTFTAGTHAMSPDVKIEGKSLFGSGDWAAAEWVMSGTHTGKTPELPPTGKKFSLLGSSIMQIRDGKISRQTDYWNMTSFLQQVGILPSNTMPNRFGRLMMRLMMRR